MSIDSGLVLCCILRARDFHCVHSTLVFVCEVSSVFVCETGSFPWQYNEINHFSFWCTYCFAVSFVSVVIVARILLSFHATREFGLVAGALGDRFSATWNGLTACVTCPTFFLFVEIHSFSNKCRWHSCVCLIVCNCTVVWLPAVHFSICKPQI